MGWSRLILASALLGQIAVAQADLGASPEIPAAQGTILYFPFVAKARPLELIVTRFSNEYGCGYTYCSVNGYVLNLTNTPLYSVTVEMAVTWYPYNPLTVTVPYTSIVEIPTAFTATLPGQPNPFHFDLILGKASAYFGLVRIGATRPNPPEGKTYWPLTITQWSRTGDVISGTARNDTGRSIQQARVIAMDLTGCRWVAATPQATILPPEIETTFGTGPLYCQGGSFLVLGQGMEQ